MLKRIHYGWAIAAAGTLTIFSALGLGRFTLGMVLPSMGKALELTYAQMGLVSTANFVGYMAAVLASGWLAARVGPSRMIFLALLLVGACLCAMGLWASAVWMLVVIYFLTGAGSGAANVPMMGLVSAWFSRKLRGRASGLIVIGSGFAIILAGRLVPWINKRFPEDGWRVNWIVFGAAVIVSAIVASRVLRDKPADMGLEPVGHADAPPRVITDTRSIYRREATWHLGAIYFLFGFTYVIYITFMVTALIKDHGMTEAGAGAVWVTVGLLSLLSGPVFGTLSDSIGRRMGFAVVFALQCAAYLLAAFGGSEALLYLSAALFGMTAFSIPSIMAAAVGDYFGARRAPEAFGVVTFIFAIGQISGPYAAGRMAEESRHFTSSFEMAAALAAGAVLLSLTLRKPSN